MALVQIADLPMIAPVLQAGPDGKPGDLLSSDWYLSLSGLVERVNLSGQVVSNPIPSLAGQSGSISPTQFPIGAVTSGVYRLSWYARITQAATTSSSLTVSFGWTQNGVGLPGSGAALTANATTATQSGNAVVRSDAATTLTYSTTYVSVGATSMQYALTIFAEYLGP